ncbi:MAG: hypothetical protein LBS50_09165 [Prevotellaceae bacterium]|jgi:hypothetical protein|nr:hypothetical protein [Prevotellaceae bacterium]
MPTVGQGGAGSTGTQGGNATPQRVFKYKIVGNHLLDKLNESDILKDIAARIQHGRRLIIPIGLPQAGKSMFIASLIAYAFRRDVKEDNSCNFAHVFPREHSGVKNITDALDKNDVLPSTRPNEITIIDLDMKSRYRKRPIKITLIDLSGEDIERLTGKRADDSDGTGAKIEKILAACIARKAIFAILTPVDANMTEIGEVSEFDINEDSEMRMFINNIQTNNPQLYHLTKFLMVVTKWDTLPKRIDTATYLKLHRNQLYNEYSSNSKSYGLIPYSVGNVVSNTIINIILRSPKNFWYTLYRWCTGKHVLPWWKRIFS